MRMVATVEAVVVAVVMMTIATAGATINVFMADGRGRDMRRGVQLLRIP